MSWVHGVCVRVCACLTVRVWYKRTVQYSQIFVAFCLCVFVSERGGEGGWLIDSLLLSACSCKWESVDMPESAHKRQSINCLFHLLLSFFHSLFLSRTSLPFFKSSASRFPPCLSLSLWYPPPLHFLPLFTSLYLSAVLSFTLSPLLPMATDTQICAFQ